MTTQTVSQAVAKRDTGPVALMWSRKRHFQAVLPASVDVEAFLGTAAGALYASPKLMEYAQANPDSLIIALMECAALGHMPGTDEYYLTPRKDHGRPKVLGIEGYRGVIERMYRSGAVAKVIVREVCANDYFDYVEGEMDRPIHKMADNAQRSGAGFFADQKRGDMVGLYAYAELAGGAVSRVVLLTRDDIEAARDSGGYKPDDQYTPWNRLDGGKDHPEYQGRSMWWKTGAKRLEPWVPTSAEYRREQLRASAAAASLAERQERPALPASNGYTPPPDVVDAEIVEEQPGPASPTAARPGSRATGKSAQPATRTSTADGGRAAASQAAVDKLDKLLTSLPLGPPEDVSALLDWQCGETFAATRSHVKAVTGYLEDHLASAQGDVTAAASAIWEQYRAVHEQDAAAEASQDGGDE